MTERGFSQFGEGRCINCAFLGKRAWHMVASECFIASGPDRNSGQLYLHETIEFGRTLETVPWCYVNATNLYEEVLIELGLANGNQNSQTYEIMANDRKCPDWYPWREFSPPKESFEELRVQRLDQSRRDFEEKLQRDSQEFDLKLFEISQKVQQDSKSILESNKDVVERAERFNSRISKYFIVLVIVQIVIALITLFFPNGISLGLPTTPIFPPKL